MAEGGRSGLRKSIPGFHPELFIGGERGEGERGGGLAGLLTKAVDFSLVYNPDLTLKVHIFMGGGFPCALPPP